MLHKIPAHFNTKKAKTLWQLVLACNKVFVVNDVDFKSDGPGVFSMFQGWKYHEVQEINMNLIQLQLDHIKQVMANDDNAILFTLNKMTEDTLDISQFNSIIIPMTEAKKEIIEISLTEIDRFCIKYFKQLNVGWICKIASQYCPESIKPGNFRLQIHKN
ncbi:MAG: hypothetical protein EZS28_011749 [Streblomastix strix]|uniref:Uncharacterized protein n=1 Tax=Streblomastix strix TaxID=222440 RepID=A0A5J4WCQ4_9EUKA|nr:MAG: hypothetical protein EZS28_011749 [Streblomastix strix]